MSWILIITLFTSTGSVAAVRVGGFNSIKVCEAYGKEFIRTNGWLKDYPSRATGYWQCIPVDRL